MNASWWGLLWRVLSVLALAAGCSRPATSAAPSTAVTIAVPPASAPAPAATAAPAPPPSRRQSPIEVLPDDAVWGSPNAPVELVEFTDIQCPFCKRAEPTIAELRRRYGPERLRIVLKHNPLPFHPNARPAAAVARAVLTLRGSEASFEFLRLAFEGNTDLSRENLLTWAAQVGAPRDRVAALMDSPEVAARIEQDIALAGRLDAAGTPAFFVNGVRISGAQPLVTFIAAIDGELASVPELQKAGTPPAEIAVTRTNLNYSIPERPKPSPLPEPDTTVWRVPVGKSPVLGAPDAPVTLVVFDDLECPFCKRAQATVRELSKRYGAELRVVFKHNPLPFHKNALPAAMLVIEARAQKGDAAFFRAVDLAFDAQDLGKDSLKGIAASLGLDVGRAVRAIETTKHKDVIAEDQDLAFSLQARGTPHFFVNGRRISGAQPLDAFVTVIDAELASAKQKVAAGVPAANVYAEIMKTAKPGAEPERKEVKAPSTPRPSRGPKNAPVVIVMFSDLQCPFCRRAMPTVDAITKKYPKQVRVVFRHLPLSFHQQARIAAEASMEVFAQKGDAGFWKLLEQINKGDASPDLSEKALMGYAGAIGADPTRLQTALELGKQAAPVDEDLRAASEAGITGTPGFTVNGYFVSGAQPFEAFDRLIRRALSEAGQPKAAIAQ